MVIFLEPQAIFSSTYTSQYSLVSSCDILNLVNITTKHSPDIHCLDFMLVAKDIDFSTLDIREISLELPIHNSPANYPSFHNELTIWCFDYPEYMTSGSSSKIAASPNVTLPISKQDLSTGVLSLNITNLLLSCSSNVLSLCHLLLQINNPSLSLDICNHNCLASPKLKLDYIDYHPANTNTHNTLCTHFTIRTQRQKILLEKDPFIFEEEDIEQPSIISYDHETGIFTFLQPGSYSFFWYINLQGTTSVSCINIGVLNTTTNDLLQFTSPCVLPNQICGQQIVHVSNVPNSYLVINASAGKIQFSNIPLQASLIIHKI